MSEIEAMRPISNMIMALLISFVFYAMISAVALPNLDTPNTLEIKYNVDPNYNNVNHLNHLIVREKCPKNNHGDSACGTCVTLFEGGFRTGNSHISCTAANKCATAKSMGLAEFKSIGFSGSTNCRFSINLDCRDNALGQDVVERTELMEDLREGLPGTEKRPLISLECVRPN